MKKFLFATAGVLVLSIGSASAADIARRPAMPAKAPVYVAPPYNWTGPYVGINGGGGWGNSSFSAPLPSTNFDTSGGLVGGTLGYNWQANQIVFGLEGDIDWSHFTGSGTCGGVSCSVRNDWLGTARGRLGYAFDRFLPYVTGGAAFGNIKTAKTGIGSADESRVGWTLGGGVEYGLSGPWSIKAEYLYVDLGNGGSIGGSTASFRTSIVRAGINYRF